MAKTPCIFHKPLHACNGLGQNVECCRAAAALPCTGSTGPRMHGLEADAWPSPIKARTCPDHTYMCLTQPYPYPYPSSLQMPDL